MLGNKLLNIRFAKYHIWNNKSEGFPNMVLSTDTFNQSVRTEYSEAVNARYTFQPLWVTGITQHCIFIKYFSILLGFSRFFRSYFKGTSKLLEFKEFNKTIIPFALVEYDTGYSQLGVTRLVGYLPGSCL